MPPVRANAPTSTADAITPAKNLIQLLFMCRLLCPGRGPVLFLLQTQRLHQPSGGAQGQATDIEIQAARVLAMKKHLTEILAKNTGKPFEQVAADCERDHFMTADEAAAYGLIDKVISKR